MTTEGLPLAHGATGDAVRDLHQRLAAVGVAGPDVLACLVRLGTLADAPLPVAGIRERERLATAPRELLDRRIVLGDLGGLDAAVALLERALKQEGAIVVATDHPDRSVQ